MAVTLHIGLDLGSDTLKIAFAYEHEGRVEYGKLMQGGLPTQVAIPAVAYYDEAENAWLYGNEVDKTSNGTFINVVKIKSLLSLLLQKPDRKALERNKPYYFNKTYFPKFYFPKKRDMLDDYREMVEKNMIFEAKDTPQTICENFFRYVYCIVSDRMQRLSAEKGIDFRPVMEIALVHPARINKGYIDELTHLVECSFGVRPSKILGSTKALSMYAFWRGALKKGESLLIFDMGEKDISVAQATLQKNDRLVVEGADGHNEPLELGGNDIDNSIAEFIEAAIRERETMGTPSPGKEGHIYERGLHSKQYLFTKAIKKAKMILSMPHDDDSVFADGVPVAISCDLHIQRKLTLKEFQHCVGLDKNVKVARRIANYIVTELNRVVNNNVRKIFLSGGVVETCGIIDYIKGVVKSECKRSIEVLTFDDYNDDDDGFNILSFEDSVYAPAVGGAIVSLKNYDVATVTALSYATWETLNGEKLLSIFINRGELLNKEKNLFTIETRVGLQSGSLGVDNDELYSVAVTQDDIESGKYATVLKTVLSGGKTYVYVGNKGSEQRKLAEKHLQLKVVSGADSGTGIKFVHNGQTIAKNNAGIVFKHDGKFVKIFDSVEIVEGARIDKYGHAQPYVANNKSANVGVVKVQYPDGKVDWVLKKNIEVEFYGMGDFESSAE